MTVYKTTIFPSGSTIYIWHLASEGYKEAEFRQSFPPDAQITSIKLFHKTTKCEVWSWWGAYREETSGTISFYTGVYVNGELIGSFPTEMELGKEYSIDIPKSKIKLDGSQNIIRIAYGKFTVGDSNAYQLTFETRIEVASDKEPTMRTGRPAWSQAATVRVRNQR